MKNRIVTAVIIFFLSLAFPQHAIAADPKFSIFYSEDFQFQASGQANVKLKTILTNLTSDYIANRTTVNLGKLKILHPLASDSQGQLKIANKSTDDKTELVIDLPNASAGKDKQYSYTLSFQTLDLFAKQGNVLQLSIPNPVKNDPQVDDFRLRVSVPKSFGQPTITRPFSPDLVFTKELLGTSDAAITYSPDFGYQSFVINLKYSLENRNGSPVFLQIPVPLSNSYQNFVWTQATPRPQDTTIDDQGNWWAKYYLGPRTKQDVTISGYVQTFDRPVLDNFLSTTHLAGKKTAGGQFKSLAELYSSVLANYSYDPKLLTTRSDAELLVSSGAVSCEELSKIFIRLGGDNGLFLQNIYGLLYPNQNTFHCWLSYYDAAKGRFVSLDPALEQSSHSKSFLEQWDLSHIFLYAGQDKKPLSAISQFEAKPTLDLKEENYPVVAALRSDIPATMVSGSNFEVSVIITNDGAVQTGPQDIYISAGHLKPEKSLIHFTNLPPFSSRQVGLKFTNLGWNEFGNDIITLRLGNENYKYKINYHPFYASRLFIVILALTCAFIIFRFAKISGRLPLQRRK